MKTIHIITLVIILFSFSDEAYGQVQQRNVFRQKRHIGKKNIDKSIEFYSTKRKNLQKDSGNTNSYVQICDSLGLCYYQKKKYDDAEKYYLEAKEVSRRLPVNENHPHTYATVCRDLAVLYERTFRYDKALRSFGEAKRVFAGLPGVPNTDYADACNSLAHIYENLELYRKAEPLYLEARKIDSGLTKRPNESYANVCNGLANLYLDMKKYGEAELLDLAALKVYSSLPKKPNAEYAKVSCDLGLLYKTMRKYDKAEQFFIQSRKMLDKLADKEDIYNAYVVENLAALYEAQGQTEKARLLYLRGIKILDVMVGKEHPDYATSCSDLANFYHKMDEDIKAEPLYYKAKQIRENVLGKEHPLYAQSCVNLANFLVDEGQAGEAKTLYLEAKQLQEMPADMDQVKLDLAVTYGDLADFYMEMGQHRAAEPLLIEAKQIRLDILGKIDPDYAASCTDLGNYYAADFSFRKAEQQFIEAMDIFKNVPGKESADYAAACNNLANLYFAFMKYDKAEPLYREAKQIYAKVSGTLSPAYGMSCANLANLYWETNRYQDADSEFKESFAVNRHNLFLQFQFTNEKEKSLYIKNILGQDNIAYSFYLSSKLKSALPYRLSLFHRNLVLSSLQALKKQLSSSRDSSLIKKFNRWLNYRRYLAVLYSRPLAEQKNLAGENENKADQLEKELTRISAVFKNQQKKVGWKDIQNKLRTDEASIEFVSFDYIDRQKLIFKPYYAALLLRRDKPLPELIRLFEKKQLDSLLDLTEGLATDNGRVNRLYKGNNALYDMIWRPLEHSLTGIKRIYFAPAGNLFKISFAAIPINSKQVLSDIYQLNQLNTTASIAENDTSPVIPGDKIILYGGINYGTGPNKSKATKTSENVMVADDDTIADDLAGNENFEKLPESLHEVKKIQFEAQRAHISATVLSGAKATEESVNAITGRASPAVLHIATYGFFFPDPITVKLDSFQQKFEKGKVFKQSDNPLFRSVLLFAGANNAWNGKGTIGKEDGILTAYEVSNTYLPNTKLVVLSACESALGDIEGSEGPYGLQRAFKIAGAQNLVMSLWKVPDLETSEFMQLFYKKLFAKQPISKAFFNTQRFMKNKYRDNLYKWAGWVLVR